MASSIRLFGQEAPAVIPTVTLPARQPVARLDFLVLVLVVMEDQLVGPHLGGVLDEVGRQLRLAHLRQVRGV